MSSLWIFFILVLIHGFMGLVVGMRLTGTVIPEFAVQSKAAILQCHFSLEKDERIFSLKWYKDNHEFFRFKPSDDPPITVFPVVGVTVNTNQSSLNYLQLEPITMFSKGLYRCEISAEAPSFQTLQEDHYMQVLALPEKGPILTGVHPWYNIGDEFSAKCHVHKTFPSPKLQWNINGIPLDKKSCDCITTETFETGKALDGTTFYSSTSHVKFQVDSHYFRDGSIVVECQALFPKTHILLKNTLQSNIKSGFGFRLYAETLSGIAPKHKGLTILPLLSLFLYSVL